MRSTHTLRASSPEPTSTEPAPSCCPGQGWELEPAEHTAQTSTWPQAAVQASNTWMAFGGHTGHRYQHSPQLWWNNVHTHGPQQPGPGYHHNLLWLHRLLMSACSAFPAPPFSTVHKTLVSLSLISPLCFSSFSSLHHTLLHHSRAQGRCVGVFLPPWGIYFFVIKKTCWQTNMAVI